MKQASFVAVTKRRSFGAIHAASVAILAIFAVPAYSSVFVIPAERSTVTFDGKSKGVKPGDEVELAPGTHGPLRIRNVVGTADNPIVIRNDPNGQAIIRRTSPASKGFILEIQGSHHFVLDGSYIKSDASGHPYGIKVMYASGATSANKDAPSAFLKTTGLSTVPRSFNNCSNFTIRHVEIDGGWPSLSADGIGISTNDHDFKLIDFPNARQENMVIERTFVRNVEGEGMYIGPNYYVGDVPLRNVIIRHNRVENTGWDGIQMKSAVDGINLIHHNHLRRIGAATSGKLKGEIFGISMLDGPGKIFNNHVERAGDTGIQHWILDLPAAKFGSQSVEIYNNVVIDAGVTGATGNRGISSGHANTTRTGLKTADTLPKIYHNTIVRPRGHGIAVGSVSGSQAFVRDNIIAEPGETPIKAPTGLSQTNNRVGSVSDMGFADASALNFRLNADSPARNAGGDSFPPVDFDDIERPKDGRADQGAFEYDGTNGTARPSAPVIVSVE